MPNFIDVMGRLDKIDDKLKLIEELLLISLKYMKIEDRTRKCRTFRTKL